MPHNNARQRHVEWLKEQIEEKHQAIAKAEAYIAQLLTEVTYFKNILNQVVDDEIGQNECPVLIPEISHTQYILTSERAKVCTLGQRSPKEMLRPEYSNKTLGDVVEFVLNSCLETLNADDIAQLVFDTTNTDEYARAKNSLSTELRRGAKEGRWKQVARGLFVSNVEVATDPATEINKQYHEAGNIARRTIAELEGIARARLKSGAEPESIVHES